MIMLHAANSGTRLMGDTVAVGSTVAPLLPTSGSAALSQLTAAGAVTVGWEVAATCGELLVCLVRVIGMVVVADWMTGMSERRDERRDSAAGGLATMSSNDGCSFVLVRF